MSDKKYSCGALFSGIGGFCKGFELAGFQTKWATDFDQEVAQTYAHNFPETKFIKADLANLDLNKLDKVDIIHAGFPCQSFSQAGNRKGFNDPRGKLFDVMIDKIEASSWRPSLLVLENSPYLLSGEQGLWFEHIQERLNDLGFWFSDQNAIEVDASEHCGLPQRRKRLFMLACNKDDFDFNSLNFLPPKVPLQSIDEFLETDIAHNDYYYLSSDNKYGEMLTKVAKKLKKNQLVQLRKYYFREVEFGFCPTLTANMGLGGHNVPFLLETNGLRKLTEKECLNLQGFKEDFEFPKEIAHAAQYRMIGNSVSPKVANLIAKKVLTMLKDRTNELDLAV